MLREIVESGGDGTLCETRLVDGVTDDQVEELFQSAREADYGKIARDARRLAESLPAKGKRDEERAIQLEHEIARFKRRLEEVVVIDFFGAPGREAANGLLAGIGSAAARQQGRRGLFSEQPNSS